MMTTKPFRASTQYNDWRGTASADRGDVTDLGDWLKARNLFPDDQYLVGFDVYSRDDDVKAGLPVRATALFAVQGRHDSTEDMVHTTQGPVPVSRVDFEIDIAEFFGLFKRFSIALSRGGMLAGRDYTYLSP
jgi:hypothetical protein